MGLSALDIQSRLASGARAGPSCRLDVARAARSKPQCALRRGAPRTGSGHAASWGASAPPAPQRARKQEAPAPATVCNGLAQLDYLWYQEMPVDAVDEVYLWERLEPLLGYLQQWEIEKVQEGLHMAYDAHQGQFRKSGEKFISHPVEVARILAELRMDAETLIAGLLHDTVEDTSVVTFEEIEQWFGPSVRKIVEGETKFSKLPKLKEALDAGAAMPTDIKAMDLQQLFLAMTEEVRIVIVKLADRLHNMRTLGSLPPHKQSRIAEETLTVFVPLARLLGLYAVKEELEETSLRYAAPDAHAVLKRRLDELARDQERLMLDTKATIEERLRADPYLAGAVAGVSVAPRQKSVYSLYRKLAGKQLAAAPTRMPRSVNAGAASALRDVGQLQIVLRLHDGADGGFGAHSPLCYHALGLVHALFAPIPGSIKDYIATPKPNGYCSLHTTVLPLGLGTTGDTLIPIELQIRTDRMHKLADYGIAAENWFTKSSAPSVSRMPHRNGSPFPGGLCNGSCIPSPEAVNDANGARNGANGKDPHSLEAVQQRARRINWLDAIREWQEEFLDSLSAREFVDCITGDLLGQGVFVFTPAGDILRLPKGATVLDFAYHVHTDLGNQMVAAKVNGLVVSADHVLRNAEVVEVVSYDGPPTPAAVRRHQVWAARLQTRTAKHKLAKFLRENEHLLDTAAESEPRVLAGVNGAGLIPDLVRSNMTWLIVDCEDRSGLLASVAGAISRAHYNIHAHTGSSGKTDGEFLMNYLLEGGDPSEVESLCAELDMTPHVRSWAIGCGLPTADDTQ